MLNFDKNTTTWPFKKFRNKVYKLKQLIPDPDLNVFAQSCIFGYTIYGSKSHMFSVIVYYANLVFVTEYLYNKKDLIFLENTPLLLRPLYKRQELVDELKVTFKNAVMRLDQNLTSEMKEKIESRYK